MFDKILVTGGSGLVGSCVKGKKPSFSEVDLMREDDISEYIIDHKLDYVINCAAKVGGVKENKNKPGEFFRDNMQMTLNLFEACRKTGVKKILNVLSTCVFPDVASYPLTPDQLHNGEPHSTNFAYAYAKRMIEVMSRAYRQQYNLNAVSVIPCNVYGPRDNFNLESSHVLPALIHKCYLAKINNTDLHVWGTGKPTREFIYSEDLGSILNYTLENYDNTDPLIVSSDQEISISALVDKITTAMEFSGNIIYNNELDGQLKKPSDNSEFNKMNIKLTGIDEGIEKTVDWFVSNYKECRK